MQLEPCNLQRGSILGPAKRQVKSCRDVLVSGEEPNLTPLFLVTFIPKSNIVQLIERKKKYFPLPKAKEMAKISQYQMCKVYFKYYLLCLCERMHAREPYEKHKGRLFRELCKYAGTRRMIGEVDGCMGVQVSHCRDKAV